MSRQQSGFTLIELIIVIVILGALAVVALPRFVDLQEEAEQAAVDGVAGNLSSAFAINYAGDLANATDVQSVNDTSITIDETTGELTPDVLTSSDLEDYEISGCSAPTTQGSTTVCTVTDRDNSNASADFEVIATD